jgi:hypothetical protein
LACGDDFLSKAFSGDIQNNIRMRPNEKFIGESEIA